MKLNPIPLLMITLVATAPAAFALTEGTDGGNGGVTLRASVPMGSILNTGDPVSFQFQSRENAAVVVFDIDTRGYVHLLWPDDEVEMSSALTRYDLPEAGRELVVDSPTGAEFVFALAVADPSVIDTDALKHLRNSDQSGGKPYQISGDPFVAANMIAGDLVRGVSWRGVTFGYTMFYVNARVDHPCYLCGDCGEVGADNGTCDGYRVVQDFDRRSPLTYPLRRGYQTVEVSSNDTGQPGDSGIFASPDSSVVVNFYPYGSQVRYIDPAPAYLYGGLYDPLYWSWPYYPYCSSGWGLSIGFGWGWGWGSIGWGWGCGGYYCSGWYAPPCYGYGYGCGYGYYPSPHHGHGHGYPERFKTAYKSGAGSNNLLVKERGIAVQRDANLRIAQSDIRRSMKSTDMTSLYRSTRGKTGDLFAAYRSKPTSPRIKTRVGGAAVTPPRGRAVARGTSRGTSGRVKGATPATGTRRGAAYTPRTKGRSGDVRSGIPRYRGSAKPYKGRSGSGVQRGRTEKTRGYSTGSFQGLSRSYYTGSRSAPGYGSYPGYRSYQGYNGYRGQPSYRGQSSYQGRPSYPGMSRSGARSYSPYRSGYKGYSPYRQGFRGSYGSYRGGYSGGMRSGGFSGGHGAATRGGGSFKGGHGRR